MKLYRYFKDFGRIGSLSGVFIADEADLEWFSDVEFTVSDILGKHSEVQMMFNDTNVTEIEINDFAVLELFRVLGKHISGVTPYEFADYIDEHYENYEEDE